MDPVGANPVSIPYVHQYAGQVNALNSLTSTQVYNMTGGVLSVSAGSTAVVMEQTGGEVTGPSSWTVSSEYNWFDGTWTGSGYTEVTGTLNVLSDAVKSVTERDVTTATVAWTDSDIQLSGAVTWTQTAGNTFTVTADGHAISTQAGSPKLVLDGTLIKTAGASSGIHAIIEQSATGVFSAAGGSLTAQQGGVFNGELSTTTPNDVTFLAGTYEVQGTVTGDGEVIVDAASSIVNLRVDVGMTGGEVRAKQGVLNMHPQIAITSDQVTLRVEGADADVNVLADAALTVTVPVTVHSAGDVLVSGRLVSSKSYTMTGGKLEVNGPSTCVDMDQTTGVLTGSSSWTCSGTMNWNSGDWTGTGSTVSTGTLNIQTTADKTITERDATTAAVFWTGGDIRASGNAVWTQTAANEFAIQTDSDWLLLGDDPQLVVAGTVAKRSGDSNSVGVDVQVQAGGTLVVDTALELVLSGTGQSDGTIEVVANDSILRLRTSAFTINQDVTGAGDVVMDTAGTRADLFSTSISLTGDWLISDGTFGVNAGAHTGADAKVRVSGNGVTDYVAGGAAAASSTVDVLSGGTLSVSNDANIESALTVSVGSVVDVSASQTLAIEAAATVLLSGGEFRGDGTVANSGAATMTAATTMSAGSGVFKIVAGAGSFAITHELTLNSWTLDNEAQTTWTAADIVCASCTIANRAGATLDITGATRAIQNGGTTDGKVDNYGTITFAGENGDLTDYLNVHTLFFVRADPALLQVQSGVWRFYGKSETFGLIQVFPDACLEFAGENVRHVVHPSGRIEGDGCAKFTGVWTDEEQPRPGMDVYGNIDLLGGTYINSPDVHVWLISGGCSGPIHVADGGQLSVSNGGTAGAVTVADGGHLSVPDGEPAVTIEEVNVKNGTVNVEGELTTPKLEIDGGNVNGTGEITIPDGGEMIWRTGSMLNKNVTDIPEDIGTVTVEEGAQHTITGEEPPFEFGGFYYVNQGRTIFHTGYIECNVCLLNSTDNFTGRLNSSDSGLLSDLSACEEDYYGRKCECYLPSNLTETEYPLILDVTESTLVGDELTLVFYESYKYFNHSALFPDQGCAANWTWVSEDSVNCTRKWTGKASWNVVYDPDGIHGCGFVRRDGSEVNNAENEPMIKFSLDFQVKTWEQLPTVRDVTPYRTITHKMPFEVHFPKQVTATSGDLEIFAPVRTLASISEVNVSPSQVDNSLDATITVFTSLQWPFALVNPQFTLVPNDITGDSITVNADEASTCPNSENVPCEQTWQVAITPVATRCVLDGDYSIRFGIVCQPDRADSCPLDTATDFTTVSFKLESSNFCAQVVDEIGLVMILQSYEDAGLTETADDFIDPQWSYWRAPVKTADVSLFEAHVNTVKMLRDNSGEQPITFIEDGVLTDKGTGVSFSWAKGVAAAPDAYSYPTFQFRIVQDVLELAPDERLVVKLEVVLDVYYQNAGQTVPAAQSAKSRQQTVVLSLDKQQSVLTRQSVASQKQITVRASSTATSDGTNDGNDGDGSSTSVVATVGLSTGQAGVAGFGLILFVALVVWWRVARSRRMRKREHLARAQQQQQQQAHQSLTNTLGASSSQSNILVPSASSSSDVSAAMVGSLQPSSSQYGGLGTLHEVAEEEDHHETAV
eukprot:TRINITY_DN67357_c3_g1_i2.p1 TRINITY_DN67357_c3_g1~~TRINITY_DN67357_c3_g1_i2.p1  ORF type:complete len:1694 (+),score=867.93 TRINITY_DN67357_c3_g1_i2:193-5082(+)